MSVPFKYCRHIRDIHDSFHEGEPISWEELMSVMNIICPVEHQPLVEKYREKCPLSTNDFLLLIYELQRATAIPYEDLVWNYIKGSLRNGLFDGEDCADLKMLRSSLDPQMRLVRLDVQNVYKDHGIPDDKGRITIEQLCAVFKAMYPAKQVVYVDMCKWARAKRSKKFIGNATERSRKLCKEVDTQITQPNVQLGTESPPKLENTAHNLDVATKTTPKTPMGKEELNEMTHNQPGPLSADSEGIMQRSEGGSRGAAELPVEIMNATNKENGKDKKATQKSYKYDERPLEDVASNNVCCVSQSVAEVVSTDISKEEGDVPHDITKPVQTTTSVKQEQIKAGISTELGKAKCSLLLSSTSLDSMPSHAQKKQSARASEGVGVSASSSLPSAVYFTGVSPSDVLVERRFGLDFNPSCIRDIAPPSHRNKGAEEKRKSLPVVKLRSREERPSWEYEEVLLDAMLNRVVPEKPVDAQVLEYLGELARQEKEIKEVFSVEMDNLTSNLLASDIIEQRMMILRGQRRAQCFDRLENERLKLLADMERYVATVRKKTEKNKALLDESRSAAGVVLMEKKNDEDIQLRKDGSEPKPSILTSLSPLHAQREKFTLQKEQRANEYSQKLQNAFLSPTRTPASKALPPQRTKPSTNKTVSSIASELAEYVRTRYTLGSRNDAEGHRQSATAAHDGPIQQFMPSPLPRRPTGLGANEHFYSKVPAERMTSSQVQQQIQKDLAAQFRKFI